MRFIVRREYVMLSDYQAEVWQAVFAGKAKARNIPETSFEATR